MEILVKATAKAEKMPDTMIVKIDFFGLKKDKEESLKLLNTNVNNIKESRHNTVNSSIRIRFL